MTLNSNDFEMEENFGAAEPTGSGNYVKYCLTFIFWGKTGELLINS
jgi:hypothetical protein